MNQYDENLYKDYLKYRIFESTSLKEDFWKSVGSLFKGDNGKALSKELFGTFYSRNVGALRKHIDKCVKGNLSIDDLLNFKTPDYTFSGKLENFQILESLKNELEESLRELSEDSIEDLASHIEDLKKRREDEDKKREDEIEQLKLKLNTLIQQQEKEKAVLDNGWYKLEVNTLFKNFPKLKKEHIAIYNRLLRLLGAYLLRVFEFGFARNPVLGKIRKHVMPGNSMNEYFQFDLYIKFEALNPEEAVNQKLDVEEGEGMLRSAFRDLQENPDKTEGYLQVYNMSWKFKFKVENLEEFLVDENLDKALRKLVISNGKEIHGKINEIIEEANKLRKRGGLNIEDINSLVRNCKDGYSKIREVLNSVISEFDEDRDLESRVDDIKEIGFLPLEIKGKNKNGDFSKSQQLLDSIYSDGMTEVEKLLENLHKEISLLLIKGLGVDKKAEEEVIEILKKEAIDWLLENILDDKTSKREDGDPLTGSSEFIQTFNIPSKHFLGKVARDLIVVQFRNDGF